MDSFVAEWLGKRVADPTLINVGIPTSQQYQCVSLIKQYLREDYGIEAGYWGNAIDYWTQTNSELLTRFSRVEGSEAHRGDVVVIKTLGHSDFTEPGHIGIATGNITVDLVEILEQNGATGTGDGLGGNAIRTRFIDRSRVAGLLRPNPVVVTLPYTLAAIDPKQIEIRVDTHRWNVTIPDLATMLSRPISAASAGEIIVVNQICNHQDGIQYYIPADGNLSGYDTRDCENYIPPTPEPITVPTPPAGAYTVAGQQYEVIVPIETYLTATNAGNHISPGDKFDPGTYYIYNVYPTNDNLINISQTAGKPGAWINKLDNVKFVFTPPPEPEVLVAETVDTSWQESYVAFPKPVAYVSVKDIMVNDLTGVGKSIELKQYTSGSSTNGRVSVSGTVTKDSILYYRARTNNDPDGKLWYCIPKLDASTNTPILLVAPNPTPNAVGKLNLVGDSLQLVKTHIEKDAGQFIDLLPKWLRW